MILSIHASTLAIDPGERFSCAMDVMHELRTLLKRHGQEGAVETAVPGLTLFASQTLTEPMPVGQHAGSWP